MRIVKIKELALIDAHETLLYVEVKQTGERFIVTGDEIRALFDPINAYDG